MTNGLTNLIPMAGLGQRFADAGYTVPKPFIKINGLPMVAWVWANLPPAERWVFVVRAEHEAELKELLERTAPRGEVSVCALQHVTQGPACTVLAAAAYVDPDSALICADSDQWLDWSPSHFLDYAYRTAADGMLVTFRAHASCYAYAAVDDEGVVSEVREKDPFTSDAVCGVYYWRRASQCFVAMRAMQTKDRRTGGEFYIAPAYNELRLQGGTVRAYPIPALWSFGTPAALQRAVGPEGPWAKKNSG